MTNPIAYDTTAMALELAVRIEGADRLVMMVSATDPDDDMIQRAVTADEESLIVAALRAHRALPPALDRETIQTLLDLLNPLHGSLDEQTYDEKVDQNFDAPADAVYSVEVTAQMERDLTQAVKILESRRRGMDQPVASEDIAQKIRSLCYVYVQGKEGHVLPTENIEILEVRGIEIAAEEIARMCGGMAQPTLTAPGGKERGDV